LAPAGWNVPSEEDVETLFQNIGGPEGGHKLKSAKFWKHNRQGSNLTGFNALPVGHVTDWGNFEFDYATFWWSSTLDSKGNGKLFTSVGLIRFVNEFGTGFAVRCVKPNTNKVKEVDRFTNYFEGKEAVTINNQVWMTKNLNTDKFQNGDIIKQAKTNTEWELAIISKQPAWCYYNYDKENGEKYGKLYNWFAMKDDRKIAPKGWHVPTGGDWGNLVEYHGGPGRGGSKMKNSTGWEKARTLATNDFGFSALPGGFLDEDGTFKYRDTVVGWWKNGYEANSSYLMVGISNDVGRFFKSQKEKDWLYGFYIRCINDSLSKTNFEENSPKETEESVDKNTPRVPKRIRPVKIGPLFWMNNNLEVDKFQNGDQIFQATSEQEWTRSISKKQPAWCYYNFDSANAQKYGKLYNWYAVNDSRGLAPRGWHIAAQREWENLILQLGGKRRAATSIVGNLNGWFPDKNTKKFNGELGGRIYGNGQFNNLSSYCFWWTSSENNDNEAFSVFLTENELSIKNHSKNSGFYVRCVKD